MCKDIGKCILIIVNILFLLVASALIVIGALLQWGSDTVKSTIIPGISKLAAPNSATISMTDLSKILSDYVAVLGNAGLIIFIIGIILFVICICGTCGVCCSSRLLMIIYLVLTLTIWVLIVIFIIVFFVKRTDLQTSAKDFYKSFLKDKYVFNNGSNALSASSSGLDPTGIIDVIQAKFKCCGADNSTDFISNPTYNKNYGVIPYSCCILNDPSFQVTYSNCTTNPSTTNSNMATGCYDKLWVILNSYSTYAAYGLVGLGIILLILIIIAGVLQKSYRDKE